MGKIDETLEVIRLVFAGRKYVWISVASGLIVFSLLYYFLVSSVADNDIWISVMMSGAGHTTWSIVSSLLIASLFGVYLSLVVFKISMLRAVGGSSLFGLVGGSVGAFGVGCPTCGAFLFSLVGAPLALMYLPFRGLELQTVGVFAMLFSVFLVAKSINSKCELKL